MLVFEFGTPQGPRRLLHVHWQIPCFDSFADVDELVEAFHAFHFGATRAWCSRAAMVRHIVKKQINAPTAFFAKVIERLDLEIWCLSFG